MNYYLELKLQMFISKLQELKNKGTTSVEINVDTAIDILSDIQKINIGKIPEKDLDLSSYLDDKK